MFLSIQQRYILDLLKRLGCIRRGQLCVLAEKNLSTPEQIIGPRHVDAMLRQLKCCTDVVRLEDDLVCYGCASPDTDHLEAVDVMLELSEGRPLDFRLEQESGLLLRFTVEHEGKLRLFGVVPYLEDDSSHLSRLPIHRTERVIFLMGKTRLPNALILPYKPFFALRKEDGTHQFFSGGDQ